MPIRTANHSSRDRFSQSCRRAFADGAAVLLFFGLISAGTALAFDTQGNKIVKVMTYNVDEGTDYTEILSSRSFTEFLNAVQTTINNVRATNPPLRAVALAQQISSAEPDFVGLQEATLWRTGPTMNPTSVEFDFIQLILNELARQGHPYNLIAVTTEFDLQAPTPTGTWVRATNRDAILARADLDPESFQTLGQQTGNYSTLLPVSTPFGTFFVVRGWAYVDVSVRGTAFRFITTHLEDGEANPLLVPIQQAQALELLGGPAKVSMPVVLVGDFNATADDATNASFASYTTITNGGFTDAWSAVNPTLAGFTCCQTPGDANPVSQLSHRIDLVFVSGPVAIDSARLFGADAEEDRTEGLWPSDHASVAAKLNFSASK